MAARFQQSLTTGTDSICASLAASFLESELESLLKYKLVGDVTFKNKLFGYGQPLGTFSSKTMLAFSLGVISDNTMKTLLFIDRLNKEFERNYSAFSFENSPLTEQVYELTSLAYSAYEVPPRRYFNNVALTALILIHSGYKKKKLKEKIEPVISDSKRKKVMKNLGNIVDDMMQYLHHN